jgi:hypothetical protein
MFVLICNEDKKKSIHYPLEAYVKNVFFCDLFNIALNVHFMHIFSISYVGLTVGLLLFILNGLETLTLSKSAFNLNGKVFMRHLNFLF